MGTMKSLLSMALALLVLPLTSCTADNYPNISHEGLLKAIEAKSVTILDVNGTESFKQGHIPGALDFEAEKGNLASKLPADKSALIVAYCGCERCNAYKQAAKAAVDLGYTNVQHYSGGLAGWKAANAPLEK